MPQISVIVPVYKVEEYLNRCVESILRQTYEDFELILVDDGSPDECPKLCDAWAKRDRRISVIHKENGGLSDARNAGIALARGNYLSFVDSDDYIHPQMLEVLLNAIQTTKTKISVCGFLKTDGEEICVNGLPHTTISTAEEFYNNNTGNFTMACGKLYCKECFDGIRFPVGKLHEDRFVTYRIIFSLNSIAVVDKSYYAYFSNPHSITNKMWTPKRMDDFEACEQQIAFFAERNIALMYEFSRDYARCIVGQLNQIKEQKCQGEYAEELWMRSKAKSLLRDYWRYKRKIRDNDLWMYKEVWPKTMNVYCLINMIAKKIEEVLWSKS